MIERYFDAVGNRRPWVTWIFLLMVTGVSVAALLNGDVERLFRGTSPRWHAWQPFTAAFVHGWGGASGWVHLPLNVLLILRAGPYTERLLGSSRFLLLIVLSIVVNALVIASTAGVNGASIVIWAWGPPLAWALHVARRKEPGAVAGPMYQDLRWLLVFVYGILMVGMAGVPYLFGWRGNPAVAFFRANLFHLVAMAVGAAFTFAVRDLLRRRIERGTPA